ncbi:MAG: general secretion pathway protein G [Verrucomicrobiales bacterium]|jgi:general secretion pathway protein G
MKLTVTTNKRRKPQAGFTLIEMVLVLAIIALLVGGAIGLLGGVQDHAKELRVKGDFSAIESAIQVYESKSLRRPTTAQGLKALVDKPTVAPIPRNWGRQMDMVPLDPWGLEYGYRSPGTKRPGKFDLISAGADGIFDTPDDLGNWTEE